MPVKNWVFAFAILFTIGVILMLLNYSRLGDLFHTRVRDRPSAGCSSRPSDSSSPLQWRVPWLGALTATSPPFTTFTVAARISTTSSGAFSFCWLLDFAG